jgi:hypothetical protein
VRVTGDRIFCAWIESTSPEDQAVWAQWFDARGRVTTPARRLAPAGATTWNLNAAIDGDGRAWVVFDARADSRRDELFLAGMDAKLQATELTQLTADDGFNSKYPDLALAGGRVALTWFDERDGNQEVYLLVSDIDGLKKGGLERAAVRVTRTPGDSMGAYLAWNGREIGLAWCDDSDKQQHEIFVQRFDEGGRPVAEAQRLTRNGTSSLIPAIRPWRDGFALVWNEFTPDPRGIHGTGGRSEVFWTTVR